MSLYRQILKLNYSVKRRLFIQQLLLTLKGLGPITIALISLVMIIVSLYSIISNLIPSFVSTGDEHIIRLFYRRYLDIDVSPIQIKEYKVVKGDTLLGISKKLGTSISTLVSLNCLSSQSLTVGKRLLYAEEDVVKYRKAGSFSVFDVARKYNVHPFEVFIANGYKMHFKNECLVPGVELSWREITDMLGIGFLKPLLGRFTSGYGYRIHPVLGIRKFHSGLDISAPYGSPVRSAMYGIVEKTGYDEGYGYFIVIKHSSSTKTLYGHLSEILVKEGQRVSRGQIIGRVGDTGMTTGPHLHFEVIKNGRKVNPKRYIVR